MLYRVKKVKYLSEYRLSLQFDNGKTKVVDLEDMLRHEKNLFLQLVDLDYFRQVECDGYSICWPNGIDFCPNLLYKMGTDIPRSIKKRKKSSPKIKARKKFKSRRGLLTKRI